MHEVLLPKSPTASSDRNLLALSLKKVVGKNRQEVLRGYRRECMQVPSSFEHTMENSRSPPVKACSQPFHLQLFKNLFGISQVRA